MRSTLPLIMILAPGALLPRGDRRIFSCTGLSTAGQVAVKRNTPPRLMSRVIPSPFKHLSLPAQVNTALARNR